LVFFEELEKRRRRRRLEKQKESFYKQIRQKKLLRFGKKITND
jgi:hypothetical protein